MWTRREIAVVVVFAINVGGCLPEPDCSETATCPVEIPPDASSAHDSPADVSADANASSDDAADVSLHADAGPDRSSEAIDGGPTLADAMPDTLRDGGAAADGNARVSDAPVDAAAEASWGNFTDSRDWESVSIGIATGRAGAGSFQGGAFDGRYVYFAPSYGTRLLARYDTQAPFTLDTSWARVDLTTVSTQMQGDAQGATFAGALFDGRYLYLMPFADQPAPGGLALQCDTTASGGCLSPTSWSSFSLATIVGSPLGYAGAVYDGRYVTLVPFYKDQTGRPGTVLARFDTRAPGGFPSASSWSTFQINLALPEAMLFLGGVFDGKRIYFIPYTYNQQVFAIYDTTGSMNDFTSWSGINLNNDAGAAWSGGAFDGRYVYLTPAGVEATQAARCDTQALGGCASLASWSQFNVRALDIAAPDTAYVQYFGAAFDGRFIYFAPHASTNVSLRFDTAGNFSDPDSWSTFDLSMVSSGAALGFGGAVFDGEYVYFVPLTSPYVVRFHARRPRATVGPPAWGSFY